MSITKTTIVFTFKEHFIRNTSVWSQYSLHSSCDGFHWETFKILLHVEMTVAQFLSVWTSLDIPLWTCSSIEYCCLQICCRCFFFIVQFKANSRDRCRWKFQIISNYRKSQTNLSDTNNHALVKNNEIMIFPNLMDDVRVTRAAVLSVWFYALHWLAD